MYFVKNILQVIFKFNTTMQNRVKFLNKIYCNMDLKILNNSIDGDIYNINS